MEKGDTMFKLNKNGWGLQTELLFILFFLICLVVALIGLNRMGLLSPSSGFPNVQTNYKALEEKAKDAAKEYVHEIYSNEIDENVLVLRINHLIKNKYLEPLKENNGRECSGYVEVIKTSSNHIVYYPYIKCSDYTTFEYDERKDW